MACFLPVCFYHAALAPLECMFYPWDFVATSSFTFTILAELQAKSNPLLGQTFEYLACMHAFA